MSSSLPAVLLTTLLLCVSSSSEEASFRPRALVLPVSKDAATNQYVTHLKQRSPLVSVNLVVDLGGEFMWVDCEQGYISSSYINARCNSAQCSLARANGCGDCYAGPKPGCNNNTCGMFPANTVNGPATGGELAEDVISLHSTNGSNLGPVVSIQHFLFTCGSTFLLQGLANGVQGMAGLARNRIGMPSLFAAAFSLHKKFAICLPSSSSSAGVVFFGNGPYVMDSDIDISANLTYTPLLINPVSTAPVYTEGDPSYEYFIGVKSIKVNKKSIPLNTSLLTIQRDGYGGTKFSTVNPYTVLETSIYKAVTTAFVRETGLSRVGSVAPFEFCFDARKVVKVVPIIDLVLQSSNAVWRMSNLTVQAANNVICLAILDGGMNPRSSIVIGGYQMENRLLQFDLATSRLGFSSWLSGTTDCSRFKFKSNFELQYQPRLSIMNDSI